MNACSARCGWCGACDDGVRERPEPRDYLFCDACGKDAMFPITLAGVGIACSDKCMNRLALQHENALMGRK